MEASFQPSSVSASTSGRSSSMSTLDAGKAAGDIAIRMENSYLSLGLSDIGRRVREPLSLRVDSHFASDTIPSSLENSILDIEQSKENLMPPNENIYGLLAAEEVTLPPSSADDLVILQPFNMCNTHFMEYIFIGSGNGGPETFKEAIQSAAHD